MLGKDGMVPDFVSLERTTNPPNRRWSSRWPMNKRARRTVQRIGSSKAMGSFSGGMRGVPPGNAWPVEG
jgi:hypothetical protein